ncbi:MAG: hypothetical protein M1522_01550 [Actinobacteria bacterium]|nr:hypothetical protein [Actinomycetota bacterium]
MALRPADKWSERTGSHTTMSTDKSTVTGGTEGPVAVAHLASDETLVEVGWSYGLTADREWRAGAWLFAARAGAVNDPEGALRAAIADHLGRAGSNPNRYPFNWGDAIDEINDGCWARHGLRSIRLGARTHISVDHDETFAEPECAVCAVPVVRAEGPLWRHVSQDDHESPDVDADADHQAAVRP